MRTQFLQTSYQKMNIYDPLTYKFPPIVILPLWNCTPLIYLTCKKSDKRQDVCVYLYEGRDPSVCISLLCKKTDLLCHNWVAKNALINYVSMTLWQIQKKCIPEKRCYEIFIALFDAPESLLVSVNKKKYLLLL